MSFLLAGGTQFLLVAPQGGITPKPPPYTPAGGGFYNRYYTQAMIDEYEDYRDKVIRENEELMIIHLHNILASKKE